MATEIDPELTPPAEDEAEQLDPWARMHHAAQELARSVQALPVPTPPIVIPPLRLPRLQLTYEDDGTPSAPPDPRRIIVSVLTVQGQRHDFSDVDGLAWQTYGDGTSNFSTERLLEIQNANSDVVASYPAGTWLDVCYPAYRRPDGLKDQS